MQNLIKTVLRSERANWGIVVAAWVVLLSAASAGAQVLAPAAGKSVAENSVPDILSAIDVLKPQGNGERGNMSSTSLKAEIVEDWSTPSLKGSDLVPMEPVVGQVDDSDQAYTLEMTRVQWRPADPIDLFIMKPAGVKNPPVILYLYSYPADDEMYLQPEFRKLLAKNGFAAVGFVSALTGERYHAPRPMKEWFVSQLPEAVAGTAHDVQMILNYLATRGDLDMARVGMFGEGSGATIAILAAAVDTRIKTLDLVNPWCDWPDWMAKSRGIPEKERADFMKPEFLAAVANLDPVKWLPELKSQKIRLRDVNTDAVSPVETLQKLEAAAPPNVEVVRYEDIKAFRAAISGGTAFDWIKQQMQPGKSQEYQASGHAQARASRRQKE